MSQQCGQGVHLEANVHIQVTAAAWKHTAWHSEWHGAFSDKAQHNTTLGHTPQKQPRSGRWRQVDIPSSFSTPMAAATNGQGSAALRAAWIMSKLSIRNTSTLSLDMTQAVGATGVSWSCTSSICRALTAQPYTSGHFLAGHNAPNWSLLHGCASAPDRWMVCNPSDT